MAFGSCAEQDRPQPIWNRISEANPDLFLFIGDNIYADTEDMRLMQERYEQLAAIPQFRRFRERVPILATWDDHDYGVNDGGAEYPQKARSKELFLDFFGEPANSPRRAREGIYTSAYYGESPQRVQILVLDMRWFRSPLLFQEGAGYVANPDPQAQILGEAQWAWLEEELQKPADLRILVSSIQLVSSQHGWEKWACFPFEKARLYRLLDRLRIRNLFAISGDMHFGELSAETTPGGFELFDFTSSGLSLVETAEGVPNDKRLIVADQDCNFGVVDIDWESSPPRVKLQLRGEGGQALFTREIQPGGPAVEVK